jgi:peptidoglycan/LPS O-acetylase OafA/YrhL
MLLLRRMLRGQAAVWAVCGSIVAVAPSFVLTSMFNQVPYPDYGFVRVCGVMAIGFALLAILISQKLDEVWWWSWAFAITDGGVAIVTAMNALFGKPPASGAFFWWVFALVNGALAGGLLTGLARAGEEKPFA